MWNFETMLDMTMTLFTPTIRFFVNKCNFASCTTNCKYLHGCWLPKVFVSICTLLDYETYNYGTILNLNGTFI